MTVYGPTEHQNLVMEVMSSKDTNFFPKWGTYICHYFTMRDLENFKECIEDRDFEVFTEQVCLASAKYLELQKVKTKV